MPRPTSALDAVPHWRVRHRKGHVIYGEGETPVALYRLEEGCARLQLDSSSGTRLILAFLFPGDLFGLGVEHHHSSCEAVTAVQLSRYAWPQVLDLAANTPEVTTELLAAAGGSYANLAHRLVNARRPAPDRVLAFLRGLMLRLHGRNSGDLQLPMNHREIADHLALSEETVSRVMRQLREAGSLTTTGRGSLVLRDPTREVEDRSFAKPARTGLQVLYRQGATPALDTLSPRGGRLDVRRVHSPPERLPPEAAASGR